MMTAARHKRWRCTCSNACDDDTDSPQGRALQGIAAVAMLLLVLMMMLLSLVLLVGCVVVVGGGVVWHAWVLHPLNSCRRCAQCCVCLSTCSCNAVG